MAVARYDLNGNEPLPATEGPRLAPFKHRGKPVEIQELISPHPSEYSPGGGHAHVFKVRINKEEYALKVFKFFDVEEAREDVFQYSNHKVDDETFAFHTDPFFAECRAYAAIQELEKLRATRLKRPQLAVPCYGFIGLPAIPYEKIFRDKFGITDWNRLEEDEEQPLKERYALRALVKQLVRTEVALKDGRKMLNDLYHLRKHDIYQRDIHERNYLDGLLLDFSQAWTEPQWVTKVVAKEDVRIRRNMELGDWNRMIDRVGLKTKVRAKIEKRMRGNNVEEHSQVRYRLRKRRPR